MLITSSAYHQSTRVPGTWSGTYLHKELLLDDGDIMITTRVQHDTIDSLYTLYYTTLLLYHLRIYIFT